MKKLNRTNFPGSQYPTKIIQFGEGNFLRAFIDWQIDILNEKTGLNAGITVVRPIDSDFPPSLNSQDGLYTTIIRGLNELGEAVKEARVIRSVNNEINVYRDFADYLALARDENIQLVFSNTTEAGISYNQQDQFSDAPPSSYPAKLTRLMYERFTHFNGDPDKGWMLLPCELIDYNGEKLKELVLKYAAQWQLPPHFAQWIEQHNTFCSTLVDRIVTGYPRGEVTALEQEFGYQDSFWDTAEYFYLFVIQGPESVKQLLNLDQVEMNILVVDDIKPYKERKVAILNGAHTALVPVAYLAGMDYVGEAMDDPQLREFVEQAITKEIIPVLSLPQDELKVFADAVINRFRNPFIKHQLLSISLNSMTKYVTRILPQLLAYHQKFHRLPERLTFALAALIAFYHGKRNGEAIPLNDDQFWLDHYALWWRKVETQEMTLSQLVSNVLAQQAHWQVDLTAEPGLTMAVTEQLQSILDHGIRTSLRIYCKE
ncbi:tagaturonate reductase [Testudinibacter aquarius]|uniref:Tagaturonate reductase n=1 Tax=Testudinibacter aquarius TaxID=1524974 RepID=A0A4R3YEU9_9PAST|nr:tagaturonate reductase [Testudinibacter aquarius]KAE9529824.1 altronate oxidoreductase [Testudinibacter aquarius]TCV89414.1 tagaturonate reductase [Testudinibacter aquarius]TNG90082.1 tagaturonate reductase [Testudinibacter aquarius]